MTAFKRWRRQTFCPLAPDNIGRGSTSLWVTLKSDEIRHGVGVCQCGRKLSPGTDEHRDAASRFKVESLDGICRGRCGPSTRSVKVLKFDQ